MPEDTASVSKVVSLRETAVHYFSIMLVMSSVQSEHRRQGILS